MKEEGDKTFIWILAIVGLFTLFAIVAFLLITFIFSSAHNLKNVSYSPPSSFDCSNSSIQALWDSIFNMNSDNLSINYTTDGQNCTSFVAIKNTTDEVFLLTRVKMWFFTDVDILSASDNKMSPQGVSLFLSLLNNPNSNLTDFTPYLINRSINNSVDADNEFRRVFKISPGYWQTNLSTISYSFQNRSTQGNNSILTTGQIAMAYYYDAFIFSNASRPACTPNWQQSSTTCRSDDTYQLGYSDSNSCNVSPNSTYSNRTVNCDFDKNGIIGNRSTINDVNLDADVFINGNNTIESMNLTNSTYLVEIKEGNTTRISFNHNFSSALDLKNITIKEEQTSADFGYLIVSGINDTKSIFVDKLINSSSSVCIRDSHIDTISEISANCSADGEVLINCPGSNSSYSCSSINNTFMISGLTGSAAREIIPSVQNFPGNCTSNWQCADWGACSNSQQSRLCTDANNCNANNNTRTDVQVCAMPCTSNWQCTNWTDCTKDGTQTRSCTDLNGCNLNNVPEQGQTCTYTNTFNTTKLAIFIIIGVLVIAVGVVGWFLMSVLKKKSMIPSINEVSGNSV